MSNFNAVFYINMFKTVLYDMNKYQGPSSVTSLIGEYTSLALHALTTAGHYQKV
jgi:hypothetical protein